jgi:hypothetical protein
MEWSIKNQQQSFHLKGWNWQHRQQHNKEEHENNGQGREFVCLLWITCTKSFTSCFCHVLCSRYYCQNLTQQPLYEIESVSVDSILLCCVRRQEIIKVILFSITSIILLDSRDLKKRGD